MPYKVLNYSSSFCIYHSLSHVPCSLHLCSFISLTPSFSFSLCASFPLPLNSPFHSPYSLISRSFCSLSCLLYYSPPFLSSTPPITLSLSLLSFPFSFPHLMCFPLYNIFSPISLPLPFLPNFPFFSLSQLSPLFSPSYFSYSP